MNNHLFRYTYKNKSQKRVQVRLPKGFGKKYFSLVAIQAYVSLAKIIALSVSTSTLDGKSLRIKINSPPFS